MNDHSDHRRREPEWPSGDEPDRGPSAEQSVERTGFWSPLWEEEQEAQAAAREPDPKPSGDLSAAGRPNRQGNTPEDHAGSGRPAAPGGHDDFRRPSGPGGHDDFAGAPVRPGGQDDFSGAPVRPGGPGGPRGGGPGGPGGAGFAAAGGIAGAGAAGAGGPLNAGGLPGGGIPVGRGGPGGGPGGPNGGPGGPSGPNGLGGPGGPNGPGGPGGPGQNFGAGPNGRPGGPRVPGGPGFPGPDATRALGAPGEQPTMAVPMPGDRRLPPGGRPIPPHDPGEDPTIYLHQNPGHSRGEPELLTHREPDYEDDYDDYGPDVDEEDPLTDEEARALRRKKIWRRVRRTAYVCTALGIIIPVLAFFITYQMVEVESPQDLAAKQDQAVTLAWADGSEITKLAKSGANRQMLTYEQMPDIMRQAVYAAEDASFETNAGFDMTGILRAVWNQVSGGEGGGSTISQQYVKKASGDEDKTLTRKWVELVKSYKMNETYSKPDIITAYLNTIYFGRGAYGVAAAAKAYYNIDDLMTINKSQAALLAGMIQTPSRHKDTTYQQKRWEYVTGRMIANNWMTESERQQLPFQAPVPLEETKGDGLSGPLKGLPDLMIEELKTLNIDEEAVRRNGYKVTFTLDKNAQALAEQAVTEVMQGQPTTLHPGLVAVDPKTGQIKAYYPNSDGSGTDWAAARQEPGSSFKPFDLVGLLKKDKGLYETYDSSPKQFGGSKVIKNASKPGCGECTVAQAMKESLNVVFSDMVYNDVKPAGVAEAAKEAGVRSPLDNATGDINIAIGGGNTQVSTLDMASAYATFAAGGVYRAPHLIAKIEKPDGTVIFDQGNWPEYQEKPAFDEDPEKSQKIARNVTEALLPIPKSSGIPCAGDRLCAGKTGTHQYQDTPDNSKAWMVGYTTQLSTAVSLSGDKDGGYKLKDANGRIVYGSGLPGKIWKKFMDSYHAQYKLPKETFGKFVAIGKAEQKAPPSTQSQAPVTTTPPSEPTKPPKTEEPTDSNLPTTTTTRSRVTRPTSEPGIPLPGNW